MGPGQNAGWTGVAVWRTINYSNTLSHRFGTVVPSLYSSTFYTTNLVGYCAYMPAWRVAL